MLKINSSIMRQTLRFWEKQRQDVDGYWTRPRYYAAKIWTSLAKIQQNLCNLGTWHLWIQPAHQTCCIWRRMCRTSSFPLDNTHLTSDFDHRVLMWTSGDIHWTHCCSWSTDRRETRGTVSQLYDTVTHRRHHRKLPLSQLNTLYKRLHSTVVRNTVP